MEYRFGELFSWSSGKPITPIGGDIPVYGANGVVGYSTVAKYTNRIILGRVGAYCGSVAYCRGPFNATDNTLITECDENKITYQYAYNLLKHFNLNSYAGGAAQPLITQTILKHLKSDIPPLPIQRKIAKVLSAYDDLIENSTKRIRILERMAEGLYRQMFEYGGRSNAARVGQVKDWFEVTIGRTPPRKNQEYFSTESTDQKWVSIRDMRVSGMFVFDTAEKLTPAGVSESKIHISPEGSILLSFKLTVGLVSITATQVATNEAIAHFETKDRALRDYTYFYLKRFQYGTLGSTSSIANAINSEIVRKMPFVMPDRNLLLKYEKAVGSMFDCIAILARQNGNAIKQRDLLLPRLMSGKLSVEGVAE